MDWFICELCESRDWLDNRGYSDEGLHLCADCTIQDVAK